MTTLLSRPTEPRPPDAAGQRRHVAALTGALTAAGLGLLSTTVLVLVGWAAAADSGASGAEAVRASAYVWLVAHHTSLVLPTGTMAFTPLGLLLLPGALLWAAGGRAARAARVRDAGSALRLTGVMAVAYALVATVVAVVTATAAVRPVAWTAALASFVLAGGAGGAGVARAAGVRTELAERLPVRVRDAAVAASVAVAVVVAAGALLAAGSLAWNLDRAVEVSRSLGTGVVGGLLLALLGAAAAANAAVFGAAYLVGPGFAVGAGTSVAVGGVSLGAVPAFPLLAALPPDGPGPVVGWAVLAIPLVGGAAAAQVLQRRRPPGGWRERALEVTATAAAAGVLAGTLGALAGGPVAAGRLAAVGPSPWHVALAFAAEVGVGAALAFAGFGLRGRRSADVDAEAV